MDLSGLSDPVVHPYPEGPRRVLSHVRRGGADRAMTEPAVDPEWISAARAAGRLGYATSAPIRRAIKAGELEGRPGLQPRSGAWGGHGQPVLLVHWPTAQAWHDKRRPAS